MSNEIHLKDVVKYVIDKFESSLRSQESINYEFFKKRDCEETIMCRVKYGCFCSELESQDPDICDLSIKLLDRYYLNSLVDGYGIDHKSFIDKGMDEETWHDLLEYVILLIAYTYYRRNWQFKRGFDLNELLINTKYDKFGDTINAFIITNWINFVRNKDDLRNVVRDNGENQVTNMIDRSLKLISKKKRVSTSEPTSSQLDYSSFDISELGTSDLGMCEDQSVYDNDSARNAFCDLISTIEERNLWMDIDKITKYKLIKLNFDCVRQYKKEYSTFKANRGRAYIIYSQYENDPEEKLSFLKEAKGYLQWAIDHDIPSINQQARAIMWESRIAFAESLIAIIENEKRVDTIVKEHMESAESKFKEIEAHDSRRLITIITFIAGFLSLSTFGISTAKSIFYIVVVIGGLLLVLSLFSMTLSKLYVGRVSRMHYSIICIGTAIMAIGMILWYYLEYVPALT